MPEGAAGSSGAPSELHLSRIVVLGGGASRRLGQDKLTASLGRATVLATLLASLAAEHPGVALVVVGPERATPTPVTWRQEKPAGGGPVAGLAVAIADLPPSAVVGVLAGDQPFAAPALRSVLAVLRGDGPAPGGAAIGTDPAGRLDGAIGTDPAGRLDGTIGTDPAGRLDGALGTDPSGRDQPLLAVYRAGALQRAVGDEASGRSVRSVLSRLTVARVPLPARWCLDVDTPEDLEAARAAL